MKIVKGAVEMAKLTKGYRFLYWLVRLTHENWLFEGNMPEIKVKKNLWWQGLMSFILLLFSLPKAVYQIPYLVIRFFAKRSKNLTPNEKSGIPKIASMNLNALFYGLVIFFISKFTGLKTFISQETFNTQLFLTILLIISILVFVASSLQLIFYFIDIFERIANTPLEFD